MSSHAEEGPSQFDFNFKAAALHGHNEEWLLNHVGEFLLRYPHVRGATLLDFQDELKEKTTHEFDVNEVAKLVQLAELCKHSTLNKPGDSLLMWF